MAGLLIGDLAARAGVAAPTIRYYESIDLLRPAMRSNSGYRRYSEETLDELRFIRKAQRLGFSLDAIGEILRLSRAGQAPCSHVLSLGHQHLAAVEERIRRLETFRSQLAAELAKWDGNTTPTCHGLCQIIVDADADAEPVELAGMPRTRKNDRRKNARQQQTDRPRGPAMTGG